MKLISPEEYEKQKYDPKIAGEFDIDLGGIFNEQAGVSFMDKLGHALEMVYYAIFDRDEYATRKDWYGFAENASDITTDSLASQEVAPSKTSTTYDSTPT